MIELKGIIKYYDNGHKHVDVVVKEDDSVAAVKHQMGVDINVNRGKILTFLAALYEVKPSDIVWPKYIQAKDFDI